MRSWAPDCRKDPDDVGMAVLCAPKPPAPRINERRAMVHIMKLKVRPFQRKVIARRSSNVCDPHRRLWACLGSEADQPTHHPRESLSRPLSTIRD